MTASGPLHGIEQVFEIGIAPCEYCSPPKVNVTTIFRPNTKPVGRLLATAATALAAHHNLDLAVQHQHERAADRAERVRPGALEHGLHPERLLLGDVMGRNPVIDDIIEMKAITSVTGPSRGF